MATRHGAQALRGAGVSAALVLLVGCESQPMNVEQDAHLKAGDVAAQSRVHDAIEQAMGVSVTLGDDAFFAPGPVTLSHRVPAGAGGHPATGRVMERPEQWQLVRNGRACALKRLKTGEVLSLQGVECVED